ncbi:MAG: beta-propeller fold lactonase family protein [Caldilineaceae bacterium]
MTADADSTSSTDETAVGAVTIQVNIPIDQEDALNSKQPADKSNCSLREALQALYIEKAGQGCGIVPQDASEYVLDMMPGTYKLTIKKELPHITRKLTINGKNKSITIDGGGSGPNIGELDRDNSIFLVKSGGRLILNQIILKHGLSNAGGAIRNEANLSIKDSIIRENASKGEGGAIYSTGTTIIENTLFQDNFALTEGGAISSGGQDLWIKKSSFVENSSAKGGGALTCNSGGATICDIRETTFVQNQVTNLLLNWDQYDILTDGSIGGAIKNYGRFYGEKLSFQKNFTQYSKGGGAFANKASNDAYLVDSAFEDNHADPHTPEIPYAFGGAIYNEGDLHLVRVSVHDNKAIVAGGVFNRGDALTMANVTISNNQATYHGGFANGSPLHPNSQFAIAYLYHVTHTENKDQVDGKSQIATLTQLNVYLSNSIIDGGCLGGKFYTYGGNIFGKFCDTTDEPNVDPFADYKGTDGNVGVQGLTFNGGPELDAGFYTQRLDGNSPAIDASRDGIFGCLQEDVNKRDARNAERNTQPPNKCDSGAFEQGSIPPKFKAEIVPGENKDTVIGGGAGGSQGTVYFRVYQDLGMSFQQQTLDLTNDGGGSIQYEAILEDNDSGRFSLGGDLTGGLLKGTHKLLNLTCTSSQKSVRYGMLLLKTDLQDKKEIRYKLSCVTTDFNHPSAAPNQEPGPITSGEGTPGNANTTQFEVGAHSNQPTTLSASTNDSGNGAVSVGAAKQVVNAADGEQPLGTDAPITLNKGEKAIVTITCTPPTPGLFFGTVQIATNDPDRPTLTYNVSCEGAYPPTAEKLNPAGLSQASPVFNSWGIAVSPDGKQLLAGGSADTLQLFSRNTATGELSAGNKFAIQGMGSIYDIEYSVDGNFVYYASRSGDGVAVLSRAADGSLSQTQLFTATSKYICGFFNNMLKLCSIPSLDGAFALDLSPDGENLYVVSDVGGGLTVFSRNVLSGTIYPTQIFTETIEGADLLTAAGDVLVSPDGKNVYVTTRSGNKLIVFTRDLETGRLFFLRAYVDGVGGFNFLGFPGNMAISSDGKFLYVPSYGDNVLNIFKRAEGDGALELVDAVLPMDGVFSVDLSHDPDNLRLVASLYDGDAVKVFQRDRETGKLTLLDSYENGADGAIDTPVRLASSPDDQSVYTSLWSSKGVRHFQTVHHTPDLFSMSPASVKVASGNFTLSVNGSRFYPGSVVTWNGAALPTTFVNEHFLQASVPGANIGAAGSATIKVHTPTPGGGDSAGLSFAITAPNQAGVPSIESITPPAITAGSGDLALLIKGFNFTPQTVAQLNNKNVATTYVNESTLMALLLASDLQVDGPMGVTVLNNSALLASEVSAEDATVKSKPMRFESAGSGEVMQPAISTLSPSASKVSTETVWVMVNGYNFSNSADAPTQAYWNGQSRPTVVINAKTLMFQTTANDLLKAGKASVQLNTLGAGQSNKLSFTIQNANDNPLPTATSYSSELAGNQWKLTINGENFVSGAKVRYNGADRNATFISAYQLAITLSASEGKNGGVLRVVNPAPGGGSSNDLVMTSLGTLRVIYVPLLTNGKAVLEAAAGEPTQNSCAEGSCDDTDPTDQQPAATPEQNADIVEQQPATSHEAEVAQSVYLPVVSR